MIWAEEYLPSGLTALLVAVLPIWMAIIEAWIFRSNRIPPMGIAGLALGIAGIFVLLWPKLSSSTRFGHSELIGVAILLIGSLGWAYGSVLSSRWSLNVGVFAAIAWQMTLWPGRQRRSSCNGRIPSYRLDLACCSGHRLPDYLWFLDRLYLLHLAPGTRSSPQSRDLCLCESGGCSGVGMDVSR